MNETTNMVEVFKNEEFGEIRTLIEGDKVLFCASDVAKALGYANAHDAVARHCRARFRKSISFPKAMSTA